MKRRYKEGGVLPNGMLEEVSITAKRQIAQPVQIDTATITAKRRPKPEAMLPVRSVKDIVAAHGNIFGSSPEQRDIAVEYKQAQQGKKFMPASYITPRRKMAIGGVVKSKWSGSEYGQAAVSAGSGILSGMGTGAMLGTVAGVPGMVAGAIIGGVVGLASGIIGGGAAAKQRAAAQEQQRQGYLAAVDEKKTMDATRLSEATFNEKSTQFYAKLGGRIPRASGAGLVPIARDMKAVYGPTHEQSDGNGGTGVSLDDQTEVEGGGNGKRGEVIVDTAKESKVYSDAFGINGNTFADMAMAVGTRKGQIENAVKTNEDMLDRTLQAVDKTVYNPTKGTHTRNAQKLAFRSQKLIARVAQADGQLASLFDIQEQAKGDIQAQGEQIRKMAWGGTKPLNLDPLSGGSISTMSPRYTPLQLSKTLKAMGNTPDVYNPKGSIGVSGMSAGTMQLATNVGSTLLQGVGNMITLNQMSKIPTPKRAPIQGARLNSNFDVSNQLEQIDSTTGQAMKFIGDNVSNSNVATQHMKEILLNKGRSKNQLYAQKYAQERGVENQNVQLDYQNRVANSEIDYENQTNQFNRTMDYYTKQSQAIAQATQGAQDAASQYAQSKYQQQQLAMYSSLNPTGVNTTMNRAFDPNAKYDILPEYDAQGRRIKKQRYGGAIPRSRRKLKVA